MKKQNEIQRDQQSERGEILEKPAKKLPKQPAARSAGMLIKTGLRAGIEQRSKQVQ